MSEDREESLLDKPYNGITNAKEWWVVVATGPFGFRFGPYYDPVAIGKIMRESLERNVVITIIANCGTEFDWELAEDIAKIKEGES